MPNGMRAGSWLVAAVTTSCGRRRASAGSSAKAYVRFFAAPRCGSAPTLTSPLPGSASSSSRCSSTYQLRGRRPMLMSTERALGGGESWCRHELLNTVTTDWVEEHLGDPQVAVVDIRGRVIKQRDEGSDFFSTAYEGLEADYLDAHIPGAVFVDWTKDIACTDDDGVPAQLADRESFVDAMEERGIGGKKRVVVYDNGEMLFATRFWWAMRRFGHDRVSVMDGGWAKWQAERRAITPDCPCPLKVFTEWNIPPERERPGLVASAADVRASLAPAAAAAAATTGGAGAKGSGGPERGEGSAGQSTFPPVQLLDARAAVQFTGEVRRARRGGRIPGAVNTPYRAFLSEGTAGPDGEVYRVFKDLAGIKEVFNSAPVDTSPSAAPIIAYCNGGVASTVALFLLFQLRQLEKQGGSGGGDGGNETDAGGGGDEVERENGGVGFGVGSWANYDGSWNEWGNDESAPIEI